ncbi:hypothetical protein BLOT_011265, partial [Blomia tropicalis]
LAADHWEDILEHQLGHRSLGKTFSNINLAADHWEDNLEHQFDRRSLGRQSRTSIWPPIIGEFVSVAVLLLMIINITLIYQLILMFYHLFLSNVINHYNGRCSSSYSLKLNALIIY